MILASEGPSMGRYVCWPTMVTANQWAALFLIVNPQDLLPQTYKWNMAVAGLVIQINRRWLTKTYVKLLSIPTGLVKPSDMILV